MANLGVEFMALVQDSRTEGVVQRGMKLSFINNFSAFDINKLIPSVQHPVIAWTMLKGKSYAPLTSCSWHMKLQEIEGSTWLKRKKINEVMANNNTTLPFYWLLQRWKNRPEGDCPESCDAVNFRYYILLWIYHSGKRMACGGFLFPSPRTPHTEEQKQHTVFTSGESEMPRWGKPALCFFWTCKLGIPAWSEKRKDRQLIFVDLNELVVNE